LQVAGIILGYLQSRQMLDAGKAQQLKDNIDASLVLLGKANAARADAVAKHDAGVSDPNDPYRRD
jgi:hypothetical protein